MPFINSKVSVSMSKEKKDAVKAKLGQAISLVPGKSENWLMVGFEDSYDLYFQGNQDGAYGVCGGKSIWRGFSRCIYQTDRRDLQYLSGRVGNSPK